MSGNAKILTAKEATYNTAPASGWRQLEWDADDHKEDPPNTNLTHVGIRPQAGAPSLVALRQSAEGAGGTLSIPAFSNGQGIFWQASASSSTSAVVSGGTLAREQIHTFGGGGAADSISTEIHRDRQDGSLDAYTFTGGKVTQLEIGADVDALLKLKWTMRYPTSARQVSLPTRSETVVTPDFIYSWEEALITLVPYVAGVPGDLEDDGVAECIQSFNLTLPMGLDDGVKCMKRGATREEQVRVSTPEPTGTIVWRYKHPEYYDAFRSGLPFMIVADWVAPTAIEASTFPGLTLTIPALCFTGEDPQVQVAGPTMQNLPFSVYDNEADPVFTARNVTDDTAL